jgi:hypothetical protein
VSGQRLLTLTRLILRAMLEYRVFGGCSVRSSSQTQIWFYEFEERGVLWPWDVGMLARRMSSRRRGLYFVL